MCGEKRNDDRPEEGGTLNSGGPVPHPWSRFISKGTRVIDTKETRRGGAGSQSHP